MGRPRIMLDVRIFHNAKFGSLSNRAKLGWIYLMCEAKQQDREGLFPSRPLFLLGAGPYRDRASEWMALGMIHYGEALCDRCVRAFGAVPGPAVVVHDWTDYQLSRTTLWREENGLGKEGRGNTGETPGETEVKPLRARAAASLSLSKSKDVTEGGPGGTGYPAPGSDRDSLDTYHELTRWRPWGAWSGKRLHQAIDDYGDATVDEALRAAHAEDPDRDTLMDRALVRLARDAEKAKRSRPKVRVVRPVRDEAAILAAKRELLGGGAA